MSISRGTYVRTSSRLAERDRHEISGIAVRYAESFFTRCPRQVPVSRTSFYCELITNFNGTAESAARIRTPASFVNSYLGIRLGVEITSRATRTFQSRRAETIFLSLSLSWSTQSELNGGSQRQGSPLSKHELTLPTTCRRAVNARYRDTSH